MADQEGYGIKVVDDISFYQKGVFTEGDKCAIGVALMRDGVQLSRNARNPLTTFPGL